ncbi:hypothetical protein HNQ94_002053 [Salirhabdus euzebyi]|uniref:Lipoprotein n=1 Tax=Salirhabdus euzebyi TaxID=394506 RepID=A0A841Q5E4_9BACI|nr:hypothetical protein [Salirhabdus euzebyi]MBB6453604.1 hypothetical protein [Salirhabdus euzebyi]
MKKNVIILFLCLSIGFILVGCGEKSITLKGENGEETKINLEDAGDGNISVNMEGSNGEDVSITSDGDSATFSDGKSEMTTQGGANVSLPDGFPADFPVPNDGVLLTATTITNNEEGAKMYTVQYEFQQNIEELFTKYKDYANSNGFTIDQEIVSNSAYMMYVSKGDEASGYNITLSPDYEDGKQLATLQVYVPTE